MCAVSISSKAQLLREVKERGARVLDGLGVAVNQGIDA